MDKHGKVELLAPAGDMEKLKVAINYGADAVYLGGTSFGMRAKAKNFDMTQLREAVEYAHIRGVKVFVTANIFAHDEDFEGMAEYFTALHEIGVDALIIQDLGLAYLIKNRYPDVRLHASTQLA